MFYIEILLKVNTYILLNNINEMEVFTIAACPECKKSTLEFNEKWDEEYDRLDSNIPSGDLIISALNSKGIPQYICTNCGKEVYA
ncbi:hypothetical protein ACQKMN_17030 [Ureibacillus composti]